MKRVCAGFIMAVCAVSASAADYSKLPNHQIGGLGFMTLEGDDVDYTVGALVGSIASKHRVSNRFSLVPELRLGIGLDDDKVIVGNTSVDVELKYFAALSVKAQLDVTEHLYLFANPTYAYSSVKGSSGDISLSDSDSAFAIGAGAGYEFYRGVSAELSYEKFSDASVTSLGLKFPM